MAMQRTNSMRSTKRPPNVNNDRVSQYARLFYGCEMLVQTQLVATTPLNTPAVTVNNGETMQPPNLRAPATATEQRGKGGSLGNVTLQASCCGCSGPPFLPQFQLAWRPFLLQCFCRQSQCDTPNSTRTNGTTRSMPPVSIGSLRGP